MKMFEIEEMSMNAWPSIKSALSKGCILRSSRGYTNRANSANPLYIRNEDIFDVVNYAEEFYKREKLPSVFKILSLPEYSPLDQYLVDRAYDKVTETLVMKADLPEGNIADSPVTLEDSFSENWFQSFVRINRINESSYEIAKTMLGLITSDVIVASILQDNRIIACGYGAVEREYVGFFDIVVDQEYRGKGYGREIMKGIMGEAKRRGVKSGYLQVVEANEVALNLYTSLGFEKMYSYWYRRKGII
jgi:predicted GNAT family N-acyltransferase